jgi:hypothetical protein
MAWHAGQHSMEDGMAQRTATQVRIMDISMTPIAKSRWSRDQKEY